MDTSLAANLGRAQIMRTFAKWLEAHPDLPIGSIHVHVDGTVLISPAEVAVPVYSYRASEIAGLYALADAVDTEVTLTPNPYRGWDLTVTWRVGATTITAKVDVSDAALAVRPIGDLDTVQTPAELSSAA